MGIYRFSLAALVVLFHFGGLSWIVGRIAVFAFYCVSGFLIFQVLDRVYLGQSGGVRRFFCNRFVRLYPLYVVYTLLTIVLLTWLGPEAFVEPDGQRIMQGLDRPTGALALNTLTFAPSLRIDGSMPVLDFSPLLVPQGWSLGVEVSLYLLAPLVVMTTRRRPLWLALWLAVGAVAFLWGVREARFDLDRFQTAVYKNSFASAFMFFAGGACYYIRRTWGQPVPFVAFVIVLLAWLAVLTLPSLSLGLGPARSPAVFAEYLWLTIAMSALVTWTPVAGRSLDTFTGNLCYGVYLNHFVVAMVLLASGATRYLGLPGSLRFGVAVLVGSTILAFVTYQLVEHPFDRVRARVRGTSLPQAAVDRSSRWRRQLAMGAATIGMVVVASPLGQAIGYVSASAYEGEVPLSPRFNVRWRNDVGDDARGQLEKQLGLVEGEPIREDPRQRTFSYRLQLPLPTRVRSVVQHPGVEDTAGINLQRFEIPQ